MNRRELLKPLAALVATPLIMKGEEVGRQIKVDERHFIIFVDYHMVDAQELCESLSGPNCPFPTATPVIPVLVPEGKTMEEAIKIYELKWKENEGKNH